MKPIIALFLSLVLISPCYAGEGKEFTGKKAKQAAEQYFKNPKNSMMLIIETIEGWNNLVTLRMSMSGGSSGDANSTREVMTPYVLILPFDDVITNSIDVYSKATAIEKQQLLLQLPLISPTFIAVAQSSASGIEGKIYFDGKEITSDCANVDYGAITLTYSLPLVQILAQNP